MINNNIFYHNIKALDAMSSIRPDIVEFNVFLFSSCMLFFAVMFLLAYIRDTKLENSVNHILKETIGHPIQEEHINNIISDLGANHYLSSKHIRKIRKLLQKRIDNPDTVLKFSTEHKTKEL